MFPIPDKYTSTSEQIQLLRQEINKRLKQDLIYREALNNAYLVLRDIEENNVLPTYREKLTDEAKKYFFDVKLMTMPDINDIASIEDDIANVIGKLNNRVRNNNTVFRARVRENMPRLMTKLKQLHHIENDKLPTQQATHRYMLFVAPVLLKCRDFVFGRKKRLPNKSQREFQRFIADIGGEVDLKSFTDEVSQIAKGEKVIGFEQSKQLIALSEQAILSLAPEQLPLSWNIALENNQLDMLLHHDTAKIADLLSAPQYKEHLSQSAPTFNILRGNQA